MTRIADVLALDPAITERVLDRVRPVLIAHQVGCVNGEMVSRVDLRGDAGVHLPLASRIADRRPHTKAAPKQLDDAPAGQVARAARD